MSFRNAQRQMSNQVARTERNQMKLQKLRDRVRQSTKAFITRQHARLAWWQSAFGTPIAGVNWMLARVSSLWAAFLALLGFSGKSFSASASRRPVAVRRSMLRMAMVEGLEQRQLMAADILSLSDDVGTPSVIADGGVTNDFNPDINLSFSAGATYDITVENVANPGVVVYAQNNVSVAITKLDPAFGSDGTYIIKAKVDDPADAFAAPIANPDDTFTFTLDTTAPNLSVLDLVAGSDSGSSTTDNITNDSTPTIEFTAESGASLEVDWGDGAGFVSAGTATGSAQQLTLGTAYATDGFKQLQVRATDLAGNATLSAKMQILIDTASPAIASPFTLSIDENSLDNSTVGVLGLSVADATVVTFSEGAGSGAAAFDIVAAEIKVANSSLLNFESTPSFSYGVTATDLAGNSSSKSFTINLNDVSEPFNAGLTGGDATLAVVAGKLTLKNSSNVDLTFPHDITKVTAVTITGSASSDNLIVDIANMPSGLVINYNGGAGASDALRLNRSSGGPVSTVTHNFINNSDGSVVMAGGPTVNYTGLEPIVDNLSATNRVFNFTAASDLVTITAGGGGFSHRIDSNNGEFVDFNLPSATLQVNGVAAVGDSLSISVPIVGPTLSGDATVVNVSGTATIQNGIDLAGGTATVNVAAGTYTGNVSTAGKAITLAPAGASVGNVTINGNLTMDGTDTLALTMGGTIAAPTVDTLTVNGLVNLGGAVLALNTAGVTGSGVLPSTPITIINNDLADTNGAFNGLGEGAIVGAIVGNSLFKISYVGGDGNNVTLRPITVTIDANDTPPQEGGANGQFSIFLSETVTNNTVINFTVTPWTSGGTQARPGALPGGSFADPNDYVPITSPVTITAGFTEALINVIVHEDSTTENTDFERVEVRLNSVTNGINTVNLPGPAQFQGSTPLPGPGIAPAGQQQDVVTIMDNDASVITLTALDGTVGPEGNAGASADSGIFRFAISKASTNPTNVWLSIPQSNPVNALFNDWSFTLTGGATLSGIGSGNPVASTETRTVASRTTLSNIATIVTTTPHNYAVNQVVAVSGVANITDGNYTVTSVVNDTTFTFAFTSVDFLTPVGGGSVATTSNALLSIPAGVTEVLLIVNAVGDTTVERDETISITMNSLKGPSAAPVILPSLPTIGTTTPVTVTIQDDDISTITLLPAGPGGSDLAGTDPQALPGSSIGFPTAGDDGSFVVSMTNKVSEATVVNYTITSGPAHGTQVPVGTITPTPGTNGTATVSGGTVDLRQTSSGTAMTTANQAQFSVNLASIKTQGGAVLTFDHIRRSASETAQNFAGLGVANQFTINPDVDGVAISVNGINWFPVLNLTDTAVNATNALTINLERALYERGLEPNSTVFVRFLQFNTTASGTATDVGRRFENIRVVTGDYVSLSGTATIAANTNTVAIPVQVINDLVVEGTENVSITLTSATGNGDAKLDVLPINLTQQMVITDSDAAIAIIENAGNGTESGPVNGKFRVRLTDNGLPSGFSMRSDTDTTVTFELNLGAMMPDATFGVDYTLTGTDVTFDPLTSKGKIKISAGETQAFINVSVISETVVEDDEWVSLKLVNAGIIGDPQISASTVTASVAIQDEDSAFVRINAVTNASEPTGTGKFLVDLVRTTNLVTPDLPITRVTSNVNTVITYSVAVGASPIATPGADYTGLIGTVTITAGQTAAFIDVTAIDDFNLEPTETVTVTLLSRIAGDASTYILASQATDTVNILDDDTLKLSVIAGGLAKEQPVPVNSSFTLQLDNTSPAVLAAYQALRPVGPAGNIVVTYTVSGTASNGIDYASLNGTATISAGATNVVLPVNVIDDFFFDPNETVSIKLNTITAQPVLGLGGAGVQINTLADSGTVVIEDDESGQVFISKVTPAREAGTNGSVTFQLPLATPFNTVVNYSVTPFGAAPIATQGSDHSFASGQVTFLPFQTQVTVPVPVLNDATKEDVEIIPVQITGFAPGGNGAGFSFSGSAVNVPILSDQTVDVVDVIHGREGAANSTVASRSLTNNVATITTTGSHGYVNGQTVTIAGVNNAAFNGTFTIFGVTNNSFQFVRFNANVASGGSGGTVTPLAPAFVIGMQAPAQGNVTVTYQIVPAPGAAVDGVDFTTLAPFTAVISAGQTTVSVSLANIDDTLIENTENLTIQLVSLSVANANDADISIGAAMPSSASNDAQGFEIVQYSRTSGSGLATVTTARPHGYMVGQLISIASTDPVFGTDVGNKTILAVSGNSITYQSTMAGVQTPVAPLAGSMVSSATVAVLGTSTSVVSAGVATLTTAVPHAFRVGQSIAVDGQGVAFDGNYIITATTATTISYARAVADTTAAGAGAIASDAGDLPATAVSTSGSYSLNTISGTISTVNDRDMFLINITDPAKFSAVATSGTFDSQLFLFRANGVGVVENDDAVLGFDTATIGQPLGNLAAAPFNVTPGLYYIAISSFDSDPQSGGNEMWLLGNPFDSHLPPNGIGALGAIDGWFPNNPLNGTGSYKIDLVGATFAGYNTAATTSIADNDAGFVQVAGTKGKEGGDNIKFTLTQSAMSSTDTLVTYTLGTTGAVPVLPAVNTSFANDSNAVLPLTPDHTSSYLPVYTATIAAGSTSVDVIVTIIDDNLVETDTETVTLTMTGLAAPTDPQIQLGTIYGNVLNFRQGEEIAPGSGVFYNSTVDTFINNDIPGQDYGTQGFISVYPITVGPTTGPMHGLIQFNNIVGSGLIPMNSPISGATLTFGGPLGGSVDIHQVGSTQNWTAASPQTWSNLFGGNGIQVNGVEASNGKVTGTGSFSGAPLTAWVSGWVNGTTTNNGMAILPISSAWDAHSSENASVTTRPRLSIAVATSASAVIEDNDSATVTISSLAGTEPGGSILLPVGIANAGKAIVAIDKASSSNTVVTYTVVDGTAKAGTDYVGVSTTQTLTITAGQTSTTILIEVLDDNTVEGTENVVVTLQAITASDPQITLSATKATTVNIGDNDVGELSITNALNGSENNPIGPSQSFSVTNSVLTSNLVTLTTSVNHSFTAGEQVMVNIGNAIYDGEYVVFDAPTPTTFRYVKSNLDVPPAAAIGTAVQTPTDGRFMVNTTNASNVQTIIPIEIVITGPADLDATDGTDYVLRNNGVILPGSGLTRTLTLPALLTSAEITVDVLEDFINEGNERVTLKLLAPLPGANLTLSGTPGATQSFVTIVDDDIQAVSIAATDNSVNENDTGIDDGYFTVQMKYKSDADTQLVYVISGTATQSAVAPATPFGDGTRDYKVLPGTGSSSLTKTIVIPAGDTQFRLNVEAYQDFFNEVDETVTVTLDNPYAAFVPSTSTVANNPITPIVANSDTVTIVDTDFAVKIKASDSPAAEPGLLLGGFNGRFTVSVANPLPVNLVVNLTDLQPGGPGRAVLGTDYTYDSPNPTSPTQSVTILAGQTSAQLNVIVINDLLAEGTETIDMQITGFTGAPSSLTSPLPAALYIAAFPDNLATQAITDDDNITATIVGTDGKDLIGPTGNEDGNFRFNQGLVSPYWTKISYAVEPTGTTALSGSDFTAIPAGFVTIAPGATTADLTLDVLGDLIVEGTESVQLKITAVQSFTNVGLTIVAPNPVAGVGNTGTANIIDEDVASIKILGSSNAAEPAGVGAFTVQLSAPSSTDTVIAYTVAGDATNGVDYSLSPAGTVTITKGSTQALILVTVNDDQVIEATPETVQLTLAATPSAPTDPQITVDVPNQTASITIADNDSGRITIVKTLDGAEGGANGSFTMSLVDPNGLPTVTTDLNTIVVYQVSGKAVGGATNTNVLNGPDYVTLTGTATILSGQTQTVLNVNVFDDSFVELTEDVTIRLVSASTASPRAITVATPSAAVTNKEATGATATLTAPGHTFVNGQQVVVSIGDPNFDSSAANPFYTIFGVVAGVSFQYTKPNATGVASVATSGSTALTTGAATVTSRVVNANVATLSAAGHQFNVGQLVSVAIGDPVYNGTYPIISVVPGVSFSYNVFTTTSPVDNTVVANAASTLARASVSIVDNDSTELTISGGSFNEGNQIFDQARATLTLSLTNAYDVDTTWTVNSQGVLSPQNVPVTVTIRERTSGVATLTVGAHDYIVGQSIGVALAAPDTDFNGQFVISAVTATTISYALPGANVLAGPPAGGSVTVSGGARGLAGTGLFDDNTDLSDFDSTPRTVTILAGQKTATTFINFNEEGSLDPTQTFKNLVEGDEIFLTSVTGSLPVGYSVTNKAKSTVTIVDEDVATYKIDDVSVTELDPIVTPFAGWSATLNSNVVTMTTPAPHGLIVGQTFEIAGFSNPIFNGRYVVLATPAPTLNTFAYARTNADIGATVSTGTITTFPQATLTFTVSVDNPVDMPMTVNVNYTDVTGTGQTYSLVVPIAVGTDYDNGQDQATFPANPTIPGNFTRTVSVAINSDFIVEGGLVDNFGNETFKANTSIESSSFKLIPQAGRTFVNTDDGVGTITDNDSAHVILAVPAPDAVAAEPLPVNNGQFRISLANPTNGLRVSSSTPTVVQFSVATGGTNAIQDTDYELRVGTTKLSNMVTIPAGATEVLIDVVVLSDSLLEVDEFVRLSMTSLVSNDPNVSFPVGPQPESVVLITDNDTSFLTVSKVQDGNEVFGGAPINGVFELSLTKASASDTVVFYTVLNKTSVQPGFVGPEATPGVDYTTLTGTATISAGATTTQIVVNVFDDLVPEPTEKVSIYIDSFTGNPDIDITTGPRHATLDIIDDADGLFVKVEKVQDASEPGNGPQDGQFKVTLVSSLGVPVVLPLGSTGGAGGLQVNFTLNEAGSGGTAVSPTDYVNATNVVIPEGSSSALVTIDVQDDLVFEGTETVKIRLLGTSQNVFGGPVNVATGSPSQTTIGNPLYPNLASLDIVDNEVGIGAKVESVSISKGQVQRSGLKSLTVVLDQPVNAPSAGFIVRKRDDLAGGLLYTGTVAGVIATPDYVSQPGKTVVTLTFAPSSTFVDSTGGLVDGNYEVELVASLVTTILGTVHLDGDGNGTAGDNYRFGDDATDNFYRLYGDADGDGDVDPVDLFNFVVPALSTPFDNLWLDGDLDGDVDPIDLFNFVVPRLVTLRDLNGFPN